MRLVACMNPAVHLQLRGPFEAPPTVRAAVGFVLSVCDHVTFQRVGTGEALLAPRAEEGLLSGMSPLVKF